MSTITTNHEMPLPAELLHRFTVEQYHRFPASGGLGETRTELLEGWIIDMPPVGPEHNSVVTAVGKRFVLWIPDGWHVREEKSVTFKRSELLPDIAIVRGDAMAYFRRNPQPADVGLIIEVTLTTHALDREWKMSIYADALVPEYWIINLAEPRIEVYRRPRRTRGKRPAYAAREVLELGASVPLTLDGKLVRRIPVKELLPKAT